MKWKIVPTVQLAKNLKLDQQPFCNVDDRGVFVCMYIMSFISTKPCLAANIDVAEAIALYRMRIGLMLKRSRL